MYKRDLQKQLRLQMSYLISAFFMRGQELCYFYDADSKQWNHTKGVQRISATATFLDDKATSLWVAGGSGHDTLDTSQLLNLTTKLWKRSFRLPLETYGHCMVKINSTTVFLIGGGNNEHGSNKTYFVHILDGGKVIEGIFLF